MRTSALISMKMIHSYELTTKNLECEHILRFRHPIHLPYTYFHISRKTTYPLYFHLTSQNGKDA